MSLLGQSLLDTRALSAKEIDEIFLKADSLQHSMQDSLSETRADLKGAAFKSRSPVICCLFFEPSTRTRMSFQMAAYRLGFEVLTMELSSGSSLSKGETLTDTVLNFAAMKPDILVVRYGVARELDMLLPTIGIPVLNAGSGTMAHPTQGLLDAYTLRREWGALQEKRVLIFGDVLHSRVARSNFDVLTKLGAKVGVFGPKSWLPIEKGASAFAEYNVQTFDSLDQGLEWADACMGLRIQLERHETKELDLGKLSSASGNDSYLSRYGLTTERLKNLRDDVLILHPGPINHGVEFAAEVTADPRSRVLAQVTNGVAIRAALLALILGR